MYLGRWLKEIGHSRDDFVIATKVPPSCFLLKIFEDFHFVCKIAGPSAQMNWIRGGPLAVDRNNILEAIEGSLRRLQTDFIDLVQIHWPDRYVPMFGDYDYIPELDYSFVPLMEQLETLALAVKEGENFHNFDFFCVSQGYASIYMLLINLLN